MKSVGIFVDVSSLYYCINKAFPGYKLNYQKYYEEAAGDNVVYRAFAYGYQNNDDAIKFITCLKHLGYQPRYKKFEPNKHINWNVGISTDVFRIASKLDEVVIGSSDPNMVDLITWVKEQGIQTYVLSCGIPKIVKEVTDRYKEIAQDMLENRQNETATTAV